jgi:hypothetical protein
MELFGHSPTVAAIAAPGIALIHAASRSSWFVPVTNGRTSSMDDGLPLARWAVIQPRAFWTHTAALQVAVQGEICFEAAFWRARQLAQSGAASRGCCAKWSRRRSRPNLRTQLALAAVPHVPIAIPNSLQSWTMQMSGVGKVSAYENSGTDRRDRAAC